MGAFDDLIPQKGGAFDDLIPSDAPVKQNSPMQQMLGGMENLLPSAEQGTNPNVEAYGGRYLGPATIGEGDEVFYKDAQGRPVPTDSSKHVVIRDPKDGQVKVFARSEDTNEGPAVGISRVLAPGLATGPLARTPGAVGAAREAILPQGQATRDEIVQAAQRLGEYGSPVEIPRAIASDSLLTQQAGQQLRNVPVLGTPIVRNTEKAISQLGDATGEVAQNLGGASMEGAGKRAYDQITDWIGPRSKEMVKQAYDAVDEAVDPNVRGALDATQAAAAEILARRQNAMLGDSKAVGLVQDAMMRPEGMNYKGVKDLRTALGEHLDNSLLPADISKSELKQIYGALTSDLGSVVERAGSTTGKALWQRANETAAQIQARREELASIVGVKGDASPAQVFDRIVAAAGSKSRSDTDLLTKAKSVIGNDWDQVVSAVTERLGKNTQGIWQPGKFLRDWEALSPAGKSALYGTGAHRQALEDIAKISTRWPQLQKFQNPSGTAQIGMGGVAIGSLIMKPLAVLSGALDPTVVGGATTAYLISRALAKPATAASTAAWARSYERLARSATPGAISQFTLQSRNLANTLNSQLGTNLSATDFLRAIQGTNPSRSDDRK